MIALPKPTEVQTKRLLELAELAKADKEQFYQDAILAATLGNDVRLANTLTRMLHVRAVQEQLHGVPFRVPQLQDLYAGFSRDKLALLGIVFNSETPFAYPFDWLNQHGFIGGGTGTGKTNALYGIALQTMQHCPVWVFDRDKQDYRHLLRLKPELLVLDATELRYNPFEVPPGVKAEHHMTAALTVFMKSNSLLDGSENLGTKALYELYEARGIFQGKDAYPTLFDLRDKIKSYKLNPYSRDAGYRDSLLNRLESYVLAAPELYGCSRGFPIAELAERSMVLEVKGLHERHGRCLLNWVLFSLFLYRIANGQRGNTLRNLVIIDEAKWAAPPGYNENLGFVPLASVLAQSREAGLGIIIADQTADLNDAVFVQSRLKMCLRLGSGTDIERVRKTFALSDEQAAHISKLDVGEAIVRIPREDPFRIRIPRVRLG